MSNAAAALKDGSARIATDNEARNVSAYAYVIANMILTAPLGLSVLSAVMTIIAENGIVHQATGEDLSPVEAIDYIARVAKANIEIGAAMKVAGSDRTQ